MSANCCIERACMKIMLDRIISQSDNNTRQISRNYRSMKGPEIKIPKGVTALDEITKCVIVQTLQRTGGNKKAAAESLEIFRLRLYSLMRRAGGPT
jgi:DNA-binding NtrC family response regulator